MSAKASPPPPPRPDPVTLEHIYDAITSSSSSSEERAYHVVALGSVAFHAAVKLFCFEHTPLPPPPTSADAAAAAAVDARWCAVIRSNATRREGLLRQIAFLLTQRTSAVYAECRWETVSLLGELCRMDRAHASHPTTPQGVLEAKLNAYAKQNLEYLAQLPWFVPACDALLQHSKGGKEDTTDESAAAVTQQQGSSSSSSGGASREVLRERLHHARRQRRDDAGATATGAADDGEDDEDVVIALRDLLRALPTCTSAPATTTTTAASDDKGNTPHKKTVTWSPAQLQQAHNLMFIDASTSLLHLIPHVSRSSSASCAQCGKTAAAAAASNNNSSSNSTLLRCGSCRAVYYCSAACQRAHWSAAHKAPCMAYKTRCEQLLAQYYAANRNSNKRSGAGAAGGVTVLEVPLEPTLFYETRRYLYDHRDASFASVSFYDYYMKYTAQGS